MHDARDLQIKGRIVNHQQTRVYTLFAIRSFSVNKFSGRFQKKVQMQIFPLVMCEVTASRKDLTHHNARITLCACGSESTSRHYAQFTNF